MEINREHHWIAEQLATLEPSWHPDTAGARVLLEARLHTRTRISPWLAVTGVAAAVCIVALALPQTRAMAQEVWMRYVLNRIDVVRLDLSNLPVEAHVTSNGMELRAQSVDDAGQMAGFRPFVPASVLPGTPAMSVTGPIVLEETIHVSRLRSALSKLGANDVHVPDNWEGVTLRSVVGPLVTLDYPGEIQIIEARPFSLTMPAGFPLERFAEAAFRGIGVSPRDAGAMSAKFAANPAWLVDIPSDEIVNIQELPLVSGQAVLFEEYDDNGGIARETVILTTAARVYAVMSPSRDLSVKIAGALP